MIRNNIYIFSDIEELNAILSLLVVDGNLNLDVFSRHKNTAEWLLKYWGVTSEPIPVTVNANKISFTTLQEVNIASLLEVAKLIPKGIIEYLAASDTLGENVKHISISQQVPIENNITINTREFACLVWDKDYYDYLKQFRKNKNIALDDIADLTYTEDYSTIDSILALGGTNACF